MLVLLRPYVMAMWWRLWDLEDSQIDCDNVVADVAASSRSDHPLVEDEDKVAVKMTGCCHWRYRHSLLVASAGTEHKKVGRRSTCRYNVADPQHCNLWNILPWLAISGRQLCTWRMETFYAYSTSEDS
jgi:hypothetical protein